jgi:L-threonylcarbamoyladenylate synthase
LEKVDISQDFQSAIGKAADVLLAGGVIAFPTETLYGLGVDIRNEAAIRRLFTIKKRSDNSPVLILIPSIESLIQYVDDVPPIALRLIELFWPGGLTLVFKAGTMASPLLTAGTGRIGIRFSSNPVATSLARAIDSAITGTSTNISGKPACRSAQDVLDCFGENVDLILDGGKTAHSVASTVLDVTTDPPRILRQGVVSREQIKTCVSNVVDFG